MNQPFPPKTGNLIIFIYDDNFRSQYNPPFKKLKTNMKVSVHDIFNEELMFVLVFLVRNMFYCS